MSDDLVRRLRCPPFGTETSERNLMKEAAIRIAELKKDLDGAKEARDELQAVVDRCLESDQRAIKAWQEAHPGKDLMWPDRTKLAVWLLEKGNASSARIAELEAALKKIVRKTRHAHPMAYVSEYYRIARAALGEQE